MNQKINLFLVICLLIGAQSKADTISKSFNIGSSTKSVLSNDPEKGVYIVRFQTPYVSENGDRYASLVTARQANANTFCLAAALENNLDHMIPVAWDIQQSLFGDSKHILATETAGIVILALHRDLTPAIRSNSIKSITCAKASK